MNRPLHAREDDRMHEELTVANREYPLPLKALNAVVGGLESIGLSAGRLDGDSMMKSARSSTGLSDFGDDSFLEPMRVLLADGANAPLTPLARIFLRLVLVKGLQTRLMKVDYLKRHPEVLDIDVSRPVFVVGFPRTGTTVLQNLLSLHDDRRALKFWELTTPIPVSEDPAEDVRRRRKTASRIITISNLFAPEQSEVHDIGVDTFEECWPLFVSAFAVFNYDLQSAFANYGEWILSHDMRGPYEEYKQYLQILASRSPGRQLLLKCPEHLWFLDSLLETFPDASIVWTHRDPVASVASYCSLISLPRRWLYGRFDPKLIGPYITDRFLDGVQRAMAVRDRLGSDRFHDVAFLDTVRDPKGVVRQVCERFDLPYGADGDARIDAWLDNSRKDGKHTHKYSGERYGLSTDELHARFKTYIDRFDIPVSSGR